MRPKLLAGIGASAGPGEDFDRVILPRDINGEAALGIEDQPDAPGLLRRRCHRGGIKELADFPGRPVALEKICGLGGLVAEPQLLQPFGPVPILDIRKFAERCRGSPIRVRSHPKAGIDPGRIPRHSADRLHSPLPSLWLDPQRVGKARVVQQGKQGLGDPRERATAIRSKEIEQLDELRKGNRCRAAGSLRQPGREAQKIGCERIGRYADDAMAQPQRKGRVVEDEVIAYQPFEDGVDGVYDNEVLARRLALACSFPLARHGAVKRRGNLAEPKREVEIGGACSRFLGAELENERGCAVQNGRFRFLFRA